MLLGCRKPLFNSWVGKISWRSDKPLTLVFLGFPGGSAGKESTCNAQDLGSIPGLGRFPWKRERLPASVFWPGEFHGLCNPWSHKKADTTEQLSLRFTSRHICHSFSSKEQASFNVMSAVTICSDFGAQENTVCHCFNCFPIYLPNAK